MDTDVLRALEDIIDKTARSAGKRALCMGGAKNHLIAMPDCDEDLGVVCRYFRRDQLCPLEGAKMFTFPNLFSWP